MSGKLDRRVFKKEVFRLFFNEENYSLNRIESGHAEFFDSLNKVSYTRDTKLIKKEYT